MRIESVTIPHDQQRYMTTGDWLFGEVWHRVNDDHPERKARTLASSEIEDVLSVRVSDMGDWRYETLVAVHEIIEAVLCKQHGIDEKRVSEFDLAYEVARDSKNNYAHPFLTQRFGCRCKITAESEPGDDFHAPYYIEHQLATSVERMLAAELGVSWQAYEDANLELYKNDQKS